ncbi:MAG TPA: S9 family peptidase [Verrucomicrobiae bacterium]|nr:S9 family peptidase [Verrucomicrobiae bacterium]
MKKYSAGLLLIALFCLSARAGGKHPFGADDWESLHSAQPIAVSPDGKTILFLVEYGASKGPTKEEWHLVSPDGSNDRLLKLPEHFRPSGFTKDAASLYGQFEVSKRPQLALVSLSSTDAAPQVLTSIPSGIGHAMLSPDGSRFAVLANPRPLDPLEVQDVHTVVQDQPTSLFVIDADGKNGSWWCPSLRQIAGAAWSGDASSLALVSQTQMIGYHYVHSSIDVCSASGVRHLAEIPNSAASEIPTGFGGIAWSADGKELAFLSTTTDVLTPDHVWTIPAAGGKPVDRTPRLAGSAMQINGDTKGNVWVVVARGVRNEVDSFSSGKLTPVYEWPGGSIRQNPIFPEIAGAPQTLAFTVGDPSHPWNVAVPDGSKLKRITNEGDAQLAQVALGDMKIVHWKSKEGIALEGIATFPPGYVAGKKYKFLVFPHGGPEANDQLVFDAFDQIVSGMGYVVLEPEYRGSTGYGSEFLNAIYQHFGDRAYRDVDSATDFAIAQGWADPSRLAIFGWSAGGFMTSWTVTQTHRYKAAVEGAGITDWLSFIWTSDIQQIDYDARWPESDPEAFLRFSAVMHASGVTTPLLILHGAADPRVPTYQGREYFLVLAAHHKTVRMVTYPGSLHFPRLWEQRADVVHELQAWLAKYNP